MLTPDYTIKRGDTGRVISGQFTDANGPINCTGDTSRKLFMKNLATGEMKINGATFTMPAEATGNWQYAFASGDIDTVMWGALEFERTTATGQRVTHPTNNDSPYKIVRVQDDLG